MSSYTCALCGRRKERWECTQRPALNKAIVCNSCTTPREYGAKNAVRVGRVSPSVPPFSVEFEVSYPVSRLNGVERALLLQRYHFLYTLDDTVAGEYKSPIYQSLRAFYFPLGIMHGLRDLVTTDCGTHLHVSLTHKERFQQVQDEVFTPLLRHMRSNSSETRAFWGRAMSYYAAYALSSYENRCVCFNLESKHSTLEFRLPRFRSAQQYLNVLLCCLRITAYLNACFDEQARQDLTPAQIGAEVVNLYIWALAHPRETLPALTTKGMNYVPTCTHE